jgi:riboflavin synthase
MFTGIVRELGSVESVEGDGGAVRLRVRAPEAAERTAVGDSVSVNGVCLTAVASANGTLDFDVVPETLRRSSLGRLEPGAAVNVEPALRAGEPLGGHLVQGHVDGVGHVVRADDEGLEVAAPPELLRYCVEKGSIAVEGVSLTIAALGGESFTVALVPHTRAATTLGTVAPGDEVNLEVDVIAKHVERLVSPGYDPRST